MLPLPLLTLPLQVPGIPSQNICRHLIPSSAVSSAIKRPICMHKYHIERIRDFLVIVAIEVDFYLLTYATALYKFCCYYYYYFYFHYHSIHCIIRQYNTPYHIKLTHNPKRYTCSFGKYSGFLISEIRSRKLHTHRYNIRL